MFPKMFLLGVVAMIVALLACADAEAGPFRRRSTTHSTTVCQGGNCTTTAETVAVENGRTGVLRHAHSGYRREGIGFSTYSAQDALDRCCYSGRFPEVDSAVVRGRDGWYATKRYAY